MAGIAELVGVRPPSLYKHFDDRHALLSAVATEVALDLGRTMAVAVDGAQADPAAKLQSLAVAYRAFALAKPRAAALIFAGVAPDIAPTPEAQAVAARPVLEVAASIVGQADALAAARALTAFAYGFTSMEAAGAFRFGGDVEEAYGFGVAALLAGLARGRSARSRAR